MSYKVQILDQRNNQDLFNLTNTGGTGSDLFRVDRSPDFFALSWEMGDTVTYGLLREEKLIGCMAVSRQTRFIRESAQSVYYLHDLRLHPDYFSTVAYYRLVRHVFHIYREKTEWVFVTVLDSNRNTRTLTKETSLLPPVSLLGKMVHVGIPMYIPLRPNSLQSQMVRLTADEAWNEYSQTVRGINFAPADYERFCADNGYFLGIQKGREIIAVCKIVDQTKSRKLVAAKTLPVYRLLVNPLCAWKGCPPLPTKGEIFRHGYLSYYASKAGDYRRDFLSFVSRHAPLNFTYVFMGLSESEATAWKAPFKLQLSSTIYTYGLYPADLTFDYRELTLV